LTEQFFEKITIFSLKLLSSKCTSLNHFQNDESKPSQLIHRKLTANKPRAFDFREISITKPSNYS